MVIFDQLFSLLLHRLHRMLEGPTVAVPVWWFFTERTPFVYKISKCYDDCCCEVQHPQHSGFISGLSILNSWEGEIIGDPTIGLNLLVCMRLDTSDVSYCGALCIWRPFSSPIAWSQVPRLKFYKERTTACLLGGRVQ